MPYWLVINGVVESKPDTARPSDHTTLTNQANPTSQTTRPYRITKPSQPYQPDHQTIPSDQTKPTLPARPHQTKYKKGKPHHTRQNILRGDHTSRAKLYHKTKPRPNHTKQNQTRVGHTTPRKTTHCQTIPHQANTLHGILSQPKPNPVRHYHLNPN